MLFADSKLRGEMKTDSLHSLQHGGRRQDISNLCFLVFFALVEIGDSNSEKYQQRGFYPSRMGSTTPRPRPKNHNARAGVPTGRTRRSPRAATARSRISQRA